MLLPSGHIEPLLWIQPCKLLVQTPVYKDYNRTEDEFKRCFMGFLTEQCHYDYMPGYKKIWYD